MDIEGVEVIEKLGRNIAWMLKVIDKAGIEPPESRPRTMMNLSADPYGYPLNKNCRVPKGTMRNSLCLFVHRFIKLVGISCVTAEMCESNHELLTELCKNVM